MYKKFKNTLAIMLCVVMMVSSVPLGGFIGVDLSTWFEVDASAIDENSGLCGDNLTYTFDDDTATLTISGSGDMYNYSYNTYNTAPWSSYIIDMKTVVIESGVTSIGKFAFAFCYSLTYISIPDTVTSIGDGALAYYCSLTSVTIPDSVTSLGNYVFRGCSMLESVTIGKSVTSLGNYLFENCTSLKSITIPNSVTHIDYLAFDGCANLETVNYLATQSQWEQITIGSGNSYLTEATINYLVENEHECYYIISEIIEATCTEDGYTTYTCECGDTYRSNETTATGHTSYTSKEAVAATCIADGSTEEISCSVCKEIITASEIIQATGHTPYTSKEAVEATCTTQGSTQEISCSVCKEIITASETIEVTEHTYGNWIIAIEATEDSEGLQIRTCSVCQSIDRETIEKLAHIHVYVESVIAPTCTENGYTLYKCACGDYYTENETQALGHDYFIKEIVVATCTKGGYTLYACECGDTYTTDVTAALGHTYFLTSTVAATCTELGYSRYECACGEGYNIYETSATGHNYSAWTTITAATATTEGLESRYCTFCGISETQIISCISPTQVNSITVENGSTWLTLNWEADSAATGYQIYMDGVKIVTLYNGETTYKVTDLDGATDYNFYIRSFSKETGSTVFGNYSSTYTFTTNPFKASFSSYSSTYESITLNWNAVAGADGYRVYQLIDGKWVSLKTVGSSTLTYSISGLEEDTEYSFKVKAYTRDVDSVAQFGVASDEYFASTKTTQVQMTTYSNTTSAIRINWESVSDADGYRVYQYIDGKWVTLATVSSSTLTYRISGLDAGTIYNFKVKAYIRDDSGTAIWQEASDTFIAMTEVGTATIISASKTSSAIRINWNEVEGATGYKIFMFVNGSWITYDTIYDSDITTYRIDGLNSGTTYYFKVQAFSKIFSPVEWGVTSSIYSVTTK